MINIVYLRLSKDDSVTIKDQEKEIKEVFGINRSNAKFYEETGSAYSIDKIQNREDFHKMLNTLFNSDKLTILDLFKRNFNETKLNLYVFGYDRISRIMEDNLLFSLLCSYFKVVIHSCKEGIIEIDPKEIPTIRFGKLIVGALNGFQAENYSWNISENVKKSIDSKRDMTFSTKGNKWGSQIRALPEHPKYYELNGNGYAKLDSEDIEALHRYIKRLLKDKSRSKVLEIVKEKKKIILSHTYLSRHFFS